MTAAVLIVTGVFLSLYDIFAYVSRRVETISSQIGGWLMYSNWTCAAFGLLCGHLVGSMPEEAAVNRYAVIVIMSGFGLILTRAQ